MEDFDVQSVAKKSVKGVFSLVFRSFFIQVLTILSNFVLAIYLDPSMFGVFFIVSAINVFLAYFQDIGLAALIIQKKEEPTLEELRTTFTVQQILVFLIVIPVFLLASQIDNLFHLGQEGIFILYAYLISFVLTSLKTIPTVILERKLDFHKLVIPQIAESLIYSLSLIIFAVLGFGINTFTYAILLRSIIGLPIIYYIQPWSIGLAFKKDLIKNLISKGSPFQGNSILALIKDDLLSLYVATLLPLSQVGYIGFGQKWAFMPLRLVMDNVIKVTFPSFSRLQHDSEGLKKLIEKSIYLIALGIFPIAAGIIVLGQNAIEVIPNFSKWQPAVIALSLFALNTVFASITVPLTNFLNAIGKVKITLKYMVLWTVLAWILTPLLIKLIGYNGVPLASALVAASLLIILVPVSKYIKLSFIKSIWKQFLAAFIMAICLYLSREIITSIPVLLLEILIGGIIYFGVMFLISKNELLSVSKFVLRTVKKEA